MPASHLSTLELHLSNERTRLAQAATAQEAAMRAVWVTQLEREIQAERTFLGLANAELLSMSDADLLKALES